MMILSVLLLNFLNTQASSFASSVLIRGALGSKPLEGSYYGCAGGFICIDLRIRDDKFLDLLVDTRIETQDDNYNWEMQRRVFSFEKIGFSCSSKGVCSLDHSGGFMESYDGTARVKKSTLVKNVLMASELLDPDLERWFFEALSTARFHNKIQFVKSGEKLRLLGVDLKRVG